MDVDPLEAVEQDDEDEGTGGKKADAKPTRKSRLNTYVAISVALLATFMGIGKVKDDNIVQAMQQAQADKIDNYAWYQARNIREEIGRTTALSLRAQKAAAPPSAQAEFDKQIAACEKLAKEQADKKQEQKDAADQADKTYNALNVHDDQFDLSDALLAIAISLFAITILTQKKWLFALAVFPFTVFGVLMGLAGLFGWGLHPDFLTRWLGT